MNGPFLLLIHYSNAMRQYTNYGNQASNDKSAHPRGVGPTGLPPGANNTIHDSATVYNEQSATGPSGAISGSQGPLPQSGGGPIRGEASQTVTEKTLVTPGSPMESLRRRHMTNQTYRGQPGVQAGQTLPMRSLAGNPNKPVPGKVHIF